MRWTIVATAGTLSTYTALAAWAALAAPEPPAAATPPPQPSAADLEFFEREVRPVLAQACYSCHGEKVQQGGLRLDSRAAVLAGGEHGPAAVAGKPEVSLLVTAVHHQGRVMPPGRKLPARQIAALERWVKQGMPWPGAAAAAPPKQTFEEAFRLRQLWWSLRPVGSPTPPAVRNQAWSNQPIDRFILAELEKKGLAPAPAADRATLARRVYLILVGLPPKPEEIDAFVRDAAPNAYEKLVDRLLASPQFGERWARHWMDVVRFGETHGYEWNYEVRDAWRYRDYLIRAFNQDVPYDQLLKEHVAGDLLPNPRASEAEKIVESPIGTAFYRFGEVGHDVFKEIGLDAMDNQIDTLSKAFQATTVSCARCHDHKLDAVSMKDYYALLGVLFSSRMVVRSIDSPAAFAPARAELTRLKGEIRAEVARTWQAEAKEFATHLKAVAAARAGQTAAAPDEPRLRQWTAALAAANPGLEDPALAWDALMKGAANPAGAWTELAARYAGEAKARAEFNRTRFTLLADFGGGQMDGWRADGPGFADGPTRPGDFAVASDGDRVLAGVLPAGLYTHLLSERLNGSVQSPNYPPGKDQISVQVMGGRNAVARVVPDQRHLGDAGRELKNERPQWITLDRSDRDERVYVELATRLDNGRLDRDQRRTDSAGEEQRSFFGIVRAVLHNQGGEPPKDELRHLLPLFRGAPPAALDEAAGRFAALFQTAVDNWAAGRATDEDVALLAWLVQKGLLTNSQSASPKLAALVADYRKAEAALPAPRRVAGLADQAGLSFDQPLYLRGDFRSEGERVPRRYLEALGDPRPFSAAGSGRLDLAERIADPANPLTSRVMVNRLWHWVFGTGLVRSVDDFGHMGEAPSHPALLDYLARAFVRDGWSVKRAVRALVLTQTFRQASRAEGRGPQVDPENRLLHHFPARRAEAEVIRDGILAVSGRLDLKLYGPSVHPYRFQEKGDRKLFAGPLDGDGRRSVYQRITLMEGGPFLSVFNQPEAKVMQGKRDVTNVPAQALALLNDPFVLQQAGVWADRLIAQPDATPATRLEGMFLAALGRKPTPSEAARFERAVQEMAALHQVGPDAILKHRDLWKDLAHAVFNIKEFIYIR